MILLHPDDFIYLDDLDFLRVSWPGQPNHYSFDASGVWCWIHNRHTASVAYPDLLSCLFCLMFSTFNFASIMNLWR